MRKSLYSIIVLLLLNVTQIFAQTPVNPGFENWTNVIIFNEPTGYVSSNYASIILGSGGLPRANVFKSTTKHTGTYSAKLESYAQNAGDSTGIPGIMITGVLDLANTTIKPGFPYAGRPAEFKGFYKYAQGVSPDSGIATVSLMKSNAVTGNSDVVGVGFVVLNNSANFKEFSTPILYTSNEIPDTAIIIISTTSTFSLDTSELLNAPVGTVLYIDDLSFFGNASGVESIDELINSNVYPNPAINLITVDFNLYAPSNYKIVLTDINGKIIFENNQEAVSGKNSIEIDTKDISNGIYFYQLTTNEGVARKPFVIAK